MTPADLTTTLAAIGWTRREFARRVGRTEGTIRYWRHVPSDVADWLARIAQAVASR